MEGTQRRHGARPLLRVVVLPLDVDRAAVAGAIQLDDHLLDLHGIPTAAGGDEVPAVKLAAHRPVAAQAARPSRAVDHLHTLDMRRMDCVGILADEGDRADSLPDHVAGVEVEADHVGAVAGVAQKPQVVAGRLDVAHRPLAGMALEVEGDSILPAGVEDRREPLDEEFEAHVEHFGDRAAADRPRPRRKLEPVAPAIGGGADETRHGDLAVLELAEIVGQADGADKVGAGLVVDHLPDVIGHEVGVGPRRLVAGLSPGDVGLHRLAADELQRLRRWLVAERLPLQVRGDGEDFEATAFRLRDPRLGVGLGARVGVALGEVELPGGLFPAVEAARRQEVEPIVFGNVAELPANEPDLVMGVLACAMLCGLMEAHGFPL